MSAPGTPPTPRVYVDPRDIITEDAFRLDPALLGTPLARPWRRAAAMSIDGILVAILANAPSVLLGLAAAFVLFRASASSSRGGYMRRSARLMVRLGGAVVLFVVAISLWDNVSERFAGGDDDEEEAGLAASVGLGDGTTAAEMTGIGGLAVAADVIALTTADTEREARERAERLVRGMRAQGVSDEEIRGVLEDFADGPEQPWMASIADSLLGEIRAVESAEQESADSLSLALAAALESGDTTAAAPLRRRLGRVLAADTVSRLSGVVREARQERARMERERDQAREEAERGGGVVAMLRSMADDLGLGFGWTGLYFTAFITLWRGRTPGKRVLGIRVIRLDGKAIGWWAAFERFGGYAASIATGLLGFFQILWDRNRQGIHDKIAETVVIRERKP